MDTELQNTINAIMKAVDTIVEKRIKEAIPVDYTQGVVQQVYNNNTMKVLINNNSQIIYNTTNCNFKINDVIWIICFDDYNQKYALFKKSAQLI